jgi:general secretion pathway protein A
MYNSYFGLLDAPFSIIPDPRLFYSNPVYLEAYASLRYGIECKKGFVVITGEVGTGKTTLLRRLLRNLDGTVRSVFVFNTYVSFPELLRVILHDLGLTPKDDSKVTMLQALNDYLIKQLELGHTVAVLVDEAQDLSEEVLEDLRLLSNLETDQEKLLQIVLMGQPELEAKLDQPRLRQLKQRVTVRCRLDPLKDEEVGPYIDFRLRAAGYQGKDLFDLAAVQQIIFHSKKIPRMVNIICDNALLLAFAESQKTVSADMIREVARNLRMESESETVTPNPAAVIIGSQSQWRTLIPGVAGRVRDMLSVGLGGVLGILAVMAVAFMILPQNLFSVPEKSFEIVKRNSNPESGPEKASAEVEPRPKEKRVTIKPGATILEIASDVYGTNTVLGLDLIKEFNPQIENLNWVSAGQDLLLPYLTPETLLRQQSDGSYHFIVASFRSQGKADEYARLLNHKGYEVSVTPRRVSDSLLLHRVEIDGLKNLEEAKSLWQTGVE